VFGILTPSPRGQCTVTLASGGDPPALLLGADGSVSYQHTSGGQLLGMLPNVRIVTTAVHMAKGDTLLLYTDGLTEARVDASRNRLGEEALLDFARAHAPTTADKLVTDLTTLLSTLTVDDDVAMLSVST
jgi:sigma-B regulation protein RsbU (phosphoserine phosphatase)